MTMTMEGKNSFVLYGSYEEQLQMLTDEQAGKLIKGIYVYMRTGEKHTDDPLVNMLLSVISHQLDIDARKYAEKKERLREAGRKGGRQKALNLAQASDAKKIVANLAVDVDEYVDADVDVDVVTIISGGDGDEEVDEHASEVIYFTENQFPTTQGELEKFQALADELFVRYAHRQPGIYDLEQVFSYGYRPMALDESTSIAVYDQEKAELLRYAFTLAANADKVNWGYIQGIYHRFGQRNIQTVMDAERYNWELYHGTESIK